MGVDKEWVSPDGQIKKQVLEKGSAGLKPIEASECRISIKNCSLQSIDVERYNKNVYVVGDSVCDFDRSLDIVLQMMRTGEVSKVTFNLDVEVSFDLHLINFISHGFFYEWNAQEKYRRAERHKEAGNELYRDNRYIDASFRFGKGLKLLCLIPIEVDKPPKEKDGLKVKDIESLKVTLYNNLASCYLKHEDYETVIGLCEDVFKIDENNVKALYKHGLSWYETHDYEKAHNSFSKLLTIDPNNKAGQEKIKLNAAKLGESRAKVNEMVKKMFKF